MKYYDIMDGKEEGYFITFDNRIDARNYLEDMTEKYSDYVKREGMHIVENERLTIGEKYEALKQENDKLKQALNNLLFAYINKDEPPHQFETDAINETRELLKEDINVK